MCGATHIHTERNESCFTVVEVKTGHRTHTVACNFILISFQVRKTKELQEQGKKINLSLSEMANLFKRMSVAIKKEEDPGSIAG